jgi:xanthine/uracil permease
VALVPVLSPTLFNQLPAWSQPFLHSSVVIACLVAVALNIALNGVSTPIKPTLENPSHGL